MNTKNKKIIEVQDWDNLVKETYKRPYNFQQQEGCVDRGTYAFVVPSKDRDDEMNDEIPEDVNGNIMGVRFEKWLARDPKQHIKKQTANYQLELFWERNFYPDIQTVANDLHKKGLLEEGEYLINIDW